MILKLLLFVCSIWFLVVFVRQYSAWRGGISGYGPVIAFLIAIPMTFTWILNSILFFFMDILEMEIKLPKWGDVRKNPKD